MNNRALIVGISNYPYELGGELPAVVADVREMKELLSSGDSRFEAPLVQTIVESAATQNQILAGVTDLFAKSKKEDTVFLYFAGHGTPFAGDYFYLTADTASGNIPGTALALTKLRKLFEECESERAVMWLDFCHSGGILARGGENCGDDDATAIERAFKQVQGLGKAILTACTNEQKAYELASHGRFTSVLLRGLKGEAADNAGEVTVNGLHDFIDRNIGTVRQRPMFLGKMTGRIVLMKPRSPVATPPLATTTPATAAQDKTPSINPAYKYLVESAETLCMFESWEAWTSHTLSASPSWKKQWMDNVEEFRRRVIRAVWPGTIPELERSLKTLSLNLTMALKEFCEHCEMGEQGWFREVKFYKAGGWNENYDRDLEAYEEWLKRQDEFIFDATKSANWVAEVVRRELNPSFFAVPGKFVVTYGPNMEGAYVTRVLEYSEEQKKAEPEAVAAKLKAVREAEHQRAKELWDEE